ncbi:MAG: DUF4143 domain-containing protein [Streptosporangiales bacterium]|nr:DUF4143 domain-containing protein [Streptosporangiales bacterium]
MGRVLPRRAQTTVEDALTDTRVVLINGARQCGKSTLARVVAKDCTAEWRNMDRPVDRKAADDDPTGFVDVGERMVIDEIQRAPELFLAIKEVVDRDFQPGRFLLTGSARILGLRGLPDTLPGRSETIELWPFSQGEIDDKPDGFIDAVFAKGASLRHNSDIKRADYAERLVRGGFPEAVGRANSSRRARFFDSYVSDLILRDISQLAEIERTAEMRSLLEVLAARSGQLLSISSLANKIQVSANTVRRYLALLEEVFLIKRIPAWSRNVSTRAVSTSKVAFVDSGIACNLASADVRSLLRPGGMFGPLMEGFVLMELARQLSWSQERADLFHYRTRDQVEVDAVLASRRGEAVAIEVKAASTVRSEDFRGLKHLDDRLGDDLTVGIVFYTGEHTLSFGPKMRAMPISALWEVPPP